jgi:hypothetical protein
MSYDLILEEIGEFGPWQKFVFFLAGLGASGGAFVTYTYTFAGYIPDKLRSEIISLYLTLSLCC